ncbi:hypothetical protein AAG570_007874 [Ranatra chinensis]|uniref:Uncharacterized protein n=1 Tax=Ranatra chinensis TaxID=642074 RepID=A0ABD0Y6D9_9HEMI
MQRSIGKRIRMDEPPPPEYDTTNPMTPIDGSEIQEPYTPYGNYNNQSHTPVHTGEIYSNENYGVLSNNYAAPQTSEDQISTPVQYDVQEQYDLHSQQLPNQSSYENQPTNSYEPPLTPLNLRGRITRSRLRSKFHVFMQIWSVGQLAKRQSWKKE